MSEVVPEEEEIQREYPVHKKLLNIARQSVEAAVKGKPIPEFTVKDPELYHRHGAFVTVKKHGELKGCIGRFISDMPLYQLVKDVAIAAVVDDPRFKYERLSETELDEINVEVSVISSLRRISNPLDFELGKHGIYIKRGERAGCLLPQVALERGWTKEEFLSYCCQWKAGLYPDAWKDPDTEVYTFVAGIVSEYK